MAYNPKGIYHYAGDSLSQELMRRIIVFAARQEMNKQVYKFQRDIVMEAARAGFRGTVGINRRVAQFARGVEQGMLNVGVQNRELETVAEKMRDAVRSSYRTKVPSTSVGPYREDDNRITRGGFRYRYSGGRLRKAIWDKNLAKVEDGRIKFADSRQLTKAAAHWARINFGTRPKSRQRKFFRMQYDGRVIGPPLGFDRDARPAFLIPFGTWRDARGASVRASAAQKGKHAFYPSSSSNAFTQEVLRPESDRLRDMWETSGGARGRRTRRVSRGLKGGYLSKGIQGAEFLNAGLAAMARETPRALDRMSEEWFDRGDEASRTGAGKALPMIYYK